MSLFWNTNLVVGILMRHFLLIFTFAIQMFTAKFQNQFVKFRFKNATET